VIETVGDTKKWLSTYYNLINVVVLLAIFLITLVIILGLGFIKVLYLLFVLLVLTMLAIGLQVSAAYLLYLQKIMKVAISIFTKPFIPPAMCTTI